MAMDEEIKYDRSLVGVEHPTGTFHVSKDMTLAFARSTGETDPIYSDEERARGVGHDGLIAPPTFCNIFTSRIARPDIKLEFGDMAFAAGQSIECISPVRPGDTLEARTKLKEVYAKTGRSGKMVFEVWETSFTNQKSATVALVQESFVHRERGR